jgi:hypothetical protein
MSDMPDVRAAVLLRYAELTREMLALAQREEWDAWLLLGEQRDECFTQLSESSQVGSLDEETRAILVETLQRNRQMEDLVANRHHELSELLQSLRQQQKISTTYR